MRLYTFFLEIQTEHTISIPIIFLYNLLFFFSRIKKPTFLL
jgi:hypothetical protein